MGELLRERSHRTFKKIGGLMGLKVQGAHKFYNKISVYEEAGDGKRGRKATKNRKR